MNEIIHLPLFISHIISLHLCLCVYFSDESTLKMNSVDHIPQTLASHIRLPGESPPQGLEGGSIMQHGADMLKPDPRDTFYSSKTVMISGCPLFPSLSSFFWPVIFYDWLIGCLAHGLSGCQFSCTQTVISPGWLCSIVCVFLCPDRLPAFWLLYLLKQEFHIHIYLYLTSNIYLLFSLSPLSSAPMIDPSRLENVLPACLYSPTYVVKDFPIARYQGLQFVSHLSRMMLLFVSICERICFYWNQKCIQLWQ